jgi:hypothetical protein
MSNGYSSVLQGPETIAAAQELRQERASKSQWPYPWTFAPPGAIRVTAGLDATGTILVPTAAAGATLGLAYTVDEGFQFALEKLVAIYLGGAILLPGDFTWSLTLNQPIGVTTFQGSPIQGFGNVDVPLGSLQFPWPLEKPEIFAPNDTIRSVFTNVNLPDGAGNFFKTIFLGWKWPA